jgi:hypothetical protein
MDLSGAVDSPDNLKAINALIAEKEDSEDSIFAKLVNEKAQASTVVAEQNDNQKI